MQAKEMQQSSVIDIKHEACTEPSKKRIHGGQVITDNRFHFLQGQVNDRKRFAMATTLESRVKA